MRNLMTKHKTFLR